MSSVGFTAKRSPSICTERAYFLPSPRTRDKRLRNSSSENSFRTSSRSMSCSFSSSSEKGRGMSVRMVARSRESSICCSLSVTLFFSAPLSWSFPDSSASIPPNCFISVTAVYSPTPGQPGMLSELSPISPSRSITFFGLSIPYFAFISSGPSFSKVPPFIGRSIQMFCPTSCP